MAIVRLPIAHTQGEPKLLENNQLSSVSQYIPNAYLKHLECSLYLINTY